VFHCQPIVSSMFGIHPIPFLFSHCKIVSTRTAPPPGFALTTHGSSSAHGQDPVVASPLLVWKLPFRWGALPISFASSSLGSCSSDGEHSPSPLPTAFKQLAPQMGSAPYLNRPVTGFHHLQISAPYLLPPWFGTR
jgi:hypothetical protein